METKLIKASQEAYIEAAALLLSGAVIGMPTETVYGLAANALDESAVAKIFEAKGRPQDNPLIVHIAEWAQLSSVATDISDNVYKLGEAFWPGPLTMILKRTKNVPDIVTAGLDTVGVRMPSHESALHLIKLSRPLAAPSANRSGRPSPTTAQHVFDDMDGRIPLIIDGGDCTVGVESTVVDMTGDVPKILRPGAITEEMIAAVLGSASTDNAARHGLKEGEAALSPGMKYRHYAPEAPVILFEGAPNDTFERIKAEYTITDGIICFDEYKEAFETLGFSPIFSLGSSWDHHAHDRNIFRILREFDETDVKRILAQCPREYGGGEGTVNRLRKSSGFMCIRCTDKQIIGVTGATGGGKSTFCNLLTSRRDDIASLNADEIYHDLLETEALIAELGASFPEALINNKVDRKALADIVFNNKDRLNILNEITHKAVLAKMLVLIGGIKAPYILLDVPLLFESGFDRYCTMTLGITADKHDAARRIEIRDNIDPTRASARRMSQPENDFYTSRCDLIIDNKGDKAAFETAILSFGEKYLPQI